MEQKKKRSSLRAKIEDFTAENKKLAEEIKYLNTRLAIEKREIERIKLDYEIGIETNKILVKKIEALIAREEESWTA